MKKLFMVLAILLSVGTGQLHAQLFQKLKDKVNNKLNGGSNSTTANSPGNPNVPVIDFAKYNINAQVTCNQGDLKGKTHQFKLDETVYKLSGNTVTADVVVYGTDRDMGEASIYQQSDGAYVYENGKLLSQKTVGEIENDANLKAAYSQMDWPYNYAGDMMGFYPGGNPANFTFNGKTFKNYMMITGLTVSKDKQHFVAVGAENGNDGVTYYFFSESRKVKLPSMGSLMLYNADFSNAAVCGFVNNIDNSGNNAVQAVGNAMNHGDVYFIDGTVRKNASMTANAWLDPSGKNILYADRQDGNYINGQKISAESSGPGNLWCGTDAGHWAYYLSTASTGSQPGHLKFYDGADIPNAVHPQQWSVNGKTYVVWLQYRNMYSGDLLLCTKEL